MADAKWTIKAREFVNCNCSYGYPCQFNAQPTHGNCEAVAGMQIDQGHHGNTRLDGLRFVGIFRWPKAIHEGNGEAAVVIDERANSRRRSKRAAIIQKRHRNEVVPKQDALHAHEGEHAREHKPIAAAHASGGGRKWRRRALLAGVVRTDWARDGLKAGAADLAESCGNRHGKIIVNFAAS